MTELDYSNSWSTDLIRATRGYRVLIVPGLRNSDDQHWQSLWHKQIPNSSRIELDNWEIADLQKWRNAIKKSLSEINEPVVLIAHSFGALASASTAAEFPQKIIATLLVAPADPDKFGIRNKLPQHLLQVPAKIIASDNDPWIKDAKAAFLALLWGADFLRIKQLGHINSDSNIGYWPEGIHELHQLVRKIKSKRNLEKFGKATTAQQKYHAA
jgi:predicted alpha/beta hydrolase family esterase